MARSALATLRAISVGTTPAALVQLTHLPAIVVDAVMTLHLRRGVSAYLTATIKSRKSRDFSFLFSAKKGTPATAVVKIMDVTSVRTAVLPSLGRFPAPLLKLPMFSMTKPVLPPISPPLPLQQKFLVGPPPKQSGFPVYNVPRSS